MVVLFVFLAVNAVQASEIVVIDFRNKTIDSIVTVNGFTHKAA